MQFAASDDEEHDSGEVDVRHPSDFLAHHSASTFIVGRPSDEDQASQGSDFQQTQPTAHSPDGTSALRRLSEAAPPPLVVESPEHSSTAIRRRVSWAPEPV